MAENLPYRGDLPENMTGHNSLTPELVNTLPATTRLSITEAYNEALLHIYLFMIPLAVVTCILLCCVTEKPLATAIDRDEPGEK